MTAFTFDEATLLAAWERAAGLPRPWKELALLAAADDTPLEDLSRMPIGERDRRLLAIQEGTFGARLDCETFCPSCGEHLELAMDAGAFRLPPRAIDQSDLVVSADSYHVTLRLPDSADIAAARRTGPDAVKVLLQRCVVIATFDGAAVSGDRLPESVCALISGRLAELDPQADLLVELSCPACEHAWESEFDPAAFLLRTVGSCAAHLIRDVHQLASAYGWREAEILALGPVRRRAYLELTAP
jgi:hypothetical protein